MLISLCGYLDEIKFMKNIPHFWETILRYIRMPCMKCHLAMRDKKGLFIW